MTLPVLTSRSVIASLRSRTSVQPDGIHTLRLSALCSTCWAQLTRQGELTGLRGRRNLLDVGVAALVEELEDLAHKAAMRFASLSSR